MLEFTFNVDNTVRQDFEGELQEFLEEIAVRLSNELKQEAPVDTGQLRQSVSIIDRSKGSITVAVQARYALAIQNGTEPYTPPLQPLKDWGARKLGSEQAGAAVWQKIREEGIDENPFVTRAVDSLEARYT